MKWIKHPDSNAYRRVYIASDDFGITYRAVKLGRSPWYLYHDGPQGTVEHPSSPIRTLESVKRHVAYDNERKHKATAK